MPFASRSWSGDRRNGRAAAPSPHHQPLAAHLTRHTRPTVTRSILGQHNQSYSLKLLPGNGSCRPRTGPHRPGSATRRHPATSRSTQLNGIALSQQLLPTNPGGPVSPPPRPRRPANPAVPPAPQSRQPSSPASPGGSPVQRSAGTPITAALSAPAAPPIPAVGQPLTAVRPAGCSPAVRPGSGRSEVWGCRRPAAESPRIAGRDGPAVPAAIQPLTHVVQGDGLRPPDISSSSEVTLPVAGQPATGLAPNPGMRRPGLPTVGSGSATGSATASRWRPRGHRRRPAGARSAPARPRSWTDPGGRTGHAQDLSWSSREADLATRPCGSPRPGPGRPRPPPVRPP